jgi:hypothetical protein
MDVRPAEAAEIDRLAQIWYDGWQDAHARIVPAELARIRTLESFKDRLRPDAEARLARAGVELAWLACAIGNERAARFYEKSGWRRAGTVVYQADAAAGVALEVWRYEKALR